MTNTPSKTITTPACRPDCVTVQRCGNTVLTVSGWFRQDTTDTAADKMAKVLEAEATGRDISHGLLDGLT
ncbi:transposon-encoded TnpW family protein [uncultured Dysosmobacter sp.]|uniref:transposon-encoded TnpW family protein n=1 Tax=uncultured Dysosmobacter sp. TaxID=2591384 RepID=UPI0026195B73|nr:transposon-encoded TnpW family protein [uncultured Dysosmobacter sp.]